MRNLSIKELVKRYLESKEKSFDCFISETIMSTNFGADVTPEHKLDVVEEEEEDEVKKEEIEEI